MEALPPLETGAGMFSGRLLPSLSLDFLAANKIPLTLL